MKVGLLGGGQLGQMMALAGKPLGLSFRAADPSADSCARSACELRTGSFDDTSFLTAFCEGLDAVTYEWENVPAAAARHCASHAPIFFPPLAALEMAQDRLDQKNFLRSLGVETAPFAAVASEADLKAAVSQLGLPAILKTRRHGYDGKGQFVLRSDADVPRAWVALRGVPCVLEGFVPFERELSIISVRGRNGAIAFYTLAQNEHREGILRVSIAPAPNAAALQKVAERAALLVLEKLDYTGVLSIECFEHEGRLLVNELATRVHNSGHWTMDGAQTSQFENHLRAGLGLPLGPTTLVAPTAMVNLIGQVPEEEALRAIPGAKLHLYGKEPRAGRKLGHLNLPLERLQDALEILSKAGVTQS